MGEKKEVMIMMKKFLALLLSVCLLAALCAGCGSTQTTAEDPATDETTAAGTEDPVTIRLGGLKGPTSMGTTMPVPLPITMRLPWLVRRMS